MIVSRHTLLDSGVPRLRRRSLLSRIALRLADRVRSIGRRGRRLTEADLIARGIPHHDLRRTETH